MHFSLTDARARAWLSERAGLPNAALDVLLDPHPRVRISLLDEGIVGVIEDLHHDFHGDPEGFGDMRFYVDPVPRVTVQTLKEDQRWATKQVAHRPSGAWS